MSTFEQIQEEIASMLSIPDGELTEEQRKAMDAYLDELASQEASKIDAFVFVVKEQTAKADFYREEGKKLADKARAIESNLKWLKGKYTEIMYRHGLKKVAGEKYAISLRESVKTCVPEDNLYQIPPEFLTEIVTVIPDKMAIKTALEEGKDVPGCFLQKSFYLAIR